MREARRRERQQALASGKRVTALMRQRGISVSALAAKVRIQRSTLENLCSGQRRIPADVLESIARELGTNVEYLKVASDDSDPPESPAL
jgi:transcriptional regulator with XRE-family HTH domain